MVRPTCIRSCNPCDGSTYSTCTLSLSHLSSTLHKNNSHKVQSNATPIALIILYTLLHFSAKSLPIISFTFYTPSIPTFQCLESPCSVPGCLNQPCQGPSPTLAFFLSLKPQLSFANLLIPEVGSEYLLHMLYQSKSLTVSLTSYITWDIHLTVFFYKTVNTAGVALLIIVPHCLGGVQNYLLTKQLPIFIEAFLSTRIQFSNLTCH